MTLNVRRGNLNAVGGRLTGYSVVTRSFHCPMALIETWKMPTGNNCQDPCCTLFRFQRRHIDVYIIQTKPVYWRSTNNKCFDLSAGNFLHSLLAVPRVAANALVESWKWLFCVW